MDVGNWFSVRLNMRLRLVITVAVTITAATVITNVYVCVGAVGILLCSVYAGEDTPNFCTIDLLGCH
jgi:hypothetical protein